MKKLSVRKIFFKAGPDIPNNPHLPVLIYRGAIAGRAQHKADRFEALFEAHGWGGSWRDGIYSYHHFHSNAHEALGIARGHAKVMLGGPAGKTVSVKAGDMLVLPAGTGHCLISGSAELQVVGAYPKGQERYDICRSLAEAGNAPRRIAAVKLPAADPYAGPGGPLLDFWKTHHVQAWNK